MKALIFFRVIQGAGAGGLIVLAVTVLGDIYEPAERAKVQGALGALGTAAGAAGPLVGALILRAANWRWAFYVNVPIGLMRLAPGRRNPMSILTSPTAIAST